MTIVLAALNVSLLHKYRHNPPWVSGDKDAQIHLDIKPEEIKIEQRQIYAVIPLDLVRLKMP